MQAILYVFSVVFGLIIGSFLNVVIYRVPKGESLISPGSHCPQCGVAIRWYDNIPIAGWVVLRGRCRACRDRISMRYPAVEAFTAGSFALAYWRFGLSWQVGFAWFVVSVLIALALIDLDHMIIPSVISLPASAVALGGAISLQPERWWIFVVAACAAAAFCFALAILWPGGGMGGGDVTMALFVGGAIGFPGVLVGFFIAFLSGTLVGLYLLLVLKRSRKTKIPFGPFLAAGAYVALFAGETIYRGYLDLFA